MSSVCSEQQKLSYFLREIEIPPRKLLTTRHRLDLSAADMFSDETLLQKYLPYNNSGGGDSDSDSGDDPYSSDHFRMYEFKVRQCTRSRNHDWTDCPFAHPGEKARRRDPRRHHYSGTVCPDFRRGGCSRGDSCEFAHGVFECWLHPARYRTEACKDGKNCKRKVCFFAHSPSQLRILPSSGTTSSPDHLSSPPAKKKFHHHHHHNHYNHHDNHLMSLSPPSNKNHCCVFCCGSGNSSVNSSPTSTLLSHLSPPISPMSGGGGVVGGGSYKNALTDLMTSLEAMHFSSKNSSNSLVLSPISGCSVRKTKRNFINESSGLSWLDVNSCVSDDQQQFILSPSTPNNQQSLLADNNFFKRYTNSTSGTNTTSSNTTSSTANENRPVMNTGENSGSNLYPDLGWVNDLLM